MFVSVLQTVSKMIGIRNFHGSNELFEITVCGKTHYISICQFEKQTINVAWKLRQLYEILF